MLTSTNNEAEGVKVECASCGATFLRERKRGRPAIRCLPCRGTQPSVLQFSKNNGRTVELKLEVIEGITWIESSEPCLECRKTFMRPRRRGRPPARCQDCQAWADATKAVEMTVSDEKLEQLYRGPKRLLQGTPDELPKGAEAQCPRPRGCGRIFTSNGACDEHKVYGANGNLKECKDPASLGMEPRSRVRDAEKDNERVVPVWTRPSIKETE